MARPDIARARTPRARVAVGVASVAAAAFAIYVALADDLPRWGVAGAQAIAHDPLPPIGNAIMLRPGAVILCEGDSLTAGTSHFGAARRPSDGPAGVPTSWPARLQAALGSAVTILNRGHGGDTAGQGEVRWRSAAAGNLVILMYGSNDAAPRGWMGSRSPVPLARFGATLDRIIARHRAAGAQVLVVAPPPTAIASAERRVAPYRLAARAAAARNGVAFHDAGAAVPALSGAVSIDGIHLRPAAYRAIGEELARRIVIVRDGA